MWTQNKTTNIHGTKKLTSRNQILVSSGLTSLDLLIGGGIPVGSIFLLEEDEFGIYSKLLTKHYLADSIYSKHTLFLASQSRNTKKMILELPAPSTTERQCASPNNEVLRIAWRYKDRTDGKEEDRKFSESRPKYDLTTTIDESSLENCKIVHWDHKDDCAYEDLFEKIKEVAQSDEYDFSKSINDRKVLRIVLYSLGYIVWKGDITKFMMKLRWVLRNICATCVVTVPQSLMQECVLARCEYFSDTVINLQSLANDGNPAYSEYDGLLFVKKLPVINTLNSHVPECNDWAFKFKKKYFIIEARMFILICLYVITFASASSPVLDIIPCIARIVEQYLHSSFLIFFADELAANSSWEIILSKTKNLTMIVTKQEARDLQGFYVLFPRKDDSYRRLFEENNFYKSKFLLIIQDQEHMREFFKEFWHFRYINVVALVIRDLKAYTFLPYAQGKCNEVGDPYLLDKWSLKNKTFVDNQNLYSTFLKLRNMMGCELKTIGNHAPPDNMMHFNGTWTANGVGDKVLDIASAYLNFTPLITSTNISPNRVWYYFDDELKYITKSVLAQTVDFAFGWYSYASIEMNNLDLTMELGRVSSIDCYGWAVPYRAGDKPATYTYYVSEFEPVTWFMIGCVFLAVSITLRLKSRRQFSHFAFVYRTFFEQPVRLQHTSRFRFLFISFCFYSLVITSAYKAAFGSFMAVPSHGREFVSMSDILNSSLHIMGSPAMRRVLNVTSMEGGTTKKMLKKFKDLEPTDFEKVMTRVIRNRDLAVLGVKRFLYYHSMHEAKRIKVKIPFRFIPGCLLRAHTTHFMFKRGSYLTKPFNIVLNRLFESGIIPYWMVHLGTNKVLPIERLKGRQIKMRYFKEPFYILIVGYGIATITFVLELIVHWRTIRKAHGTNSLQMYPK